MGKQSTISLSAKAAKVVRERVASGEYPSPEKYLGMLVLRDQERERKRAIEDLLLARLDRSSAVEVDARDSAMIRRRIARAIKGKKSA